MSEQKLPMLPPFEYCPRLSYDRDAVVVWLFSDTLSYPVAVLQAYTRFSQPDIFELFVRDMYFSWMLAARQARADEYFKAAERMREWLVFRGAMCDSRGGH